MKNPNTKAGGSKSSKHETQKHGMPKANTKKQTVSKNAGKTQSKYKIEAITKDNFQLSHIKQNITQIVELQLKYVLKCIEGLYKNRVIFITTHPDGEIFGSGDLKLNGLTLQIEGVGLSAKHAQLKYDGFKRFNVIDFGSQTGTWMNIPNDGVEITHGQQFAIGPHLVSFTFAQPLNQIQQVCMVYHITYLSDLLQQNGIHTLSQLFAAEYTNFEGYKFQNKDIAQLKRICEQCKPWYEKGKGYRRLNINYLNQPLQDLSVQIGWETYYISQDPDFVFSGNKPICEITKGKLIPHSKIFLKIKQGKTVPFPFHRHIKLGSLQFEMTRFNLGIGQDIGFRPMMQDGLIVEQDIGGNQLKRISLFAVFDGHGGPECMLYVKQNLVAKIREWTKLLDQAGDITEMVKVLMTKTFFQLDYQFYKKYPQLSQSCGCTALLILIIQSRVFSFHVGDCKSYLLRDDVLYEMSIEHLPSVGDERKRIESAGGFIQHDRLQGKCTLSRCFGQFQYKNIEDYQHHITGKYKSFLSCIPDFITFYIQVYSDAFILLSTDGIFQSMDISQVTDFIKERYNKLELQQNPNKIISGIIENCKIITEESDNMAVILLIIKKGELKP